MHKHRDNVRIQTEERWQLVRLWAAEPVRHMWQDHDEALDPLLNHRGTIERHEQGEELLQQARRRDAVRVHRVPLQKKDQRMQ